jgi:hypothetical protein
MIDARERTGSSADPPGSTLAVKSPEIAEAVFRAGSMNLRVEKTEDG